MAKQSNKYISARRKRTVQEIQRNPNITVDKLATIIAKDFNKTSKDTVRKEIKICKDIIDSIPTMSPGLSQLWKDTPVGDRLKARGSKQMLANDVVRFLLENKKGGIDKLILGTGTTVYETALMILADRIKLSIKNIFTASLLVHHAFIIHKERSTQLEIVRGRFFDKTASLIDDESVKYLREKQVDAIVTSFTGLSKKGFSASEKYELAEKQMNLNPHEKCKWVIIPMEWGKINYEDFLVKDKGEKEEPKYVIITNPPSVFLGKIDKERSEILDYWASEKGAEVRYVT